MKIRNKFLTLLIVALAEVFLSANVVLARPSFSAVKTIAIKYSLAMFGVLFFSFLLYFGLSLYTRFCVKPSIKDYDLKKRFAVACNR